MRTAGAQFPVSIDPLLTGEGLAIELGQGKGEAPEKPQFGTSVALSGDGTTALIGAPDGESHVGAAWIFHREGAKWSQQGPKLTGPGAGEEGACEGEEPVEEGEEVASCAFGSAVALDEDGSTALIGAPHRGSKPGVAWVYTRSSESTWNPEEAVALSGPTETGQQDFGFSVALSADGKHALVGAPLEHGGKGEAYVFELVGTTWTSGIPLVAAPEGSGHLGYSVALSSNGQEAIAGAPLDQLKKGTAFIFEHVGNKWEQNGGPLTGKGEVGEGRFGESVAMAGNGTAVLVGAPSENNKVGAVWTFVFRTGRWSEFEKLNGLGGPKEEFGRGVAISAEARYALIGAPKAHAKERGEGAGSISLYEAVNFEWSEPQILEAGPLEKGNGQFGKSVSMTENAETVLVGAPHESFKAGAVWLFGKRPTIEELQLPGGTKAKAKGKLSGGNKIYILGKNLKEATGVWFGPNKSLKIEERVGPSGEGPNGDQEKLEVLVPPGDEPGEVDVTVESADWLSAVNTNDQYLYVRIAGEGEGKEGEGGGPNNKGHGKEKNNEVPLNLIYNPPKATRPRPPPKTASYPPKRARPRRAPCRCAAARSRSPPTPAR